jgi:hypothetical protein
MDILKVEADYVTEMGSIIQIPGLHIHKEENPGPIPPNYRLEKTTMY